RTDHQNVMLASLPLVAVILLINAVKLEKFVIVIRESFRCRVRQCLRYCSSKKWMVFLQALVSGKFCLRFRSNHKLLSNVIYDYQASFSLCQPFCSKLDYLPFLAADSICDGHRYPFVTAL